MTDLPARRRELRREALACLVAALLLLAVAAGAGLASQVRADRLLLEGTPVSGTVTASEVRGKLAYATIAYRDPVLGPRSAEVRVDEPLHPPGRTVRLLVDGDDMRTETDWNTPWRLLAPALLGSGLGLGLLVLAAGIAVESRLRRPSSRSSRL